MAYKYWCSSKNYMENSDGQPTKFCSLDCQYCDKNGDYLTDGKDDYICPNSGIELKLFGQTVSGIIGPKLTESQIKKDRTERSRNHFKKDIFPTLDRESKRHHTEKNPSLKKI